jgi:hypothetical protein
MGPRYTPIDRLRPDQFPSKSTPADALDEALQTLRRKKCRLGPRPTFSVFLGEYAADRGGANQRPGVELGE